MYSKKEIWYDVSHLDFFMFLIHINYGIFFADNLVSFAQKLSTLTSGLDFQKVLFVTFSLKMSPSPRCHKQDFMVLNMININIFKQFGALQPLIKV